MRRSVQYSQNFLRSSPFIEGLVAKSSLSSSDVVLDIGAGKGSLTSLLAARCREVIAVEADPRLAANLRTSFADAPNVRIAEGDIRDMPLPVHPYKVFANIPFNITSDIVHKLLDGPNPPADSYLIMQLEAAEKFAGEHSRQSLFSTMHAPWFDMHIAHRFRASDFTPTPDVAVALLRCLRRINPLIADAERATYEDFVAYIFNHANPNVLPSLQKLFSGKQFAGLVATFGANTTAKPSQLAPAAWITLFHGFQQSANEQQRRLIRGTAARLAGEAANIEKYHRTRTGKNWRNTAAP